MLCIVFPLGCKKKNHIAPNIYSWDGAIIIKCSMNDSAPSAGKKLTDVLRDCLKKKNVPRNGVNPPGVPSRPRLAASGSGARCPSRPPARGPPAFPASARGPRSAAIVPVRPGSAAGSARLRPATLSIRSAVRRGVHALSERSVSARPGGAAGGGAEPSPRGAARPRWKCGSFLRAADR